MNLRSSLRTFSIVAAAAALGACAQQVGDIDRVDDNLLSKSTFDGQWYMVQTIIDTNATATAFFAGLQGPLERIHFEYSQDHLIARRVHEDIMGFDVAATNLQEEQEFSGSIVAAWPAQHVDRQRAYNPQTGEESNVITENMSDRRWYEREYVRPHFTSNAIETNANFEFSGMLESASTYQITIRPEESDATLNVEYDDDGNATYFDYVTRYVVDADWWTCFELTGFPFWGTDCGTDEIVVRTSFKRVNVTDVEDMHVPRRYDDYDMNLFGFFQTNRCYADDRYNCTDYSRIQLANIHDIWEGERDADGNALPYFERTPKPIAYYISHEYPIDLIDEAYEIGEQFSYAFRRGVAAAQGKPVEEIPRMFYTCLNPGSTDPTVPAEWASVTYNPDDLALLEEAAEASAFAYQNGICDRAGEVKNQGDIRYNFFNWRTDPAAPWYGYGPSATDPLTGEIIQGVANFNGGHLNRHAQQVLNYVKIIGGDMTAEEYGFGLPIQSWFERRQQEADYDLYYGLDWTPGAPEPKDARFAQAARVEIRNAIRNIERIDEKVSLAREVVQRPHIQRILEMPTSELRMTTGRQMDPFARVVGTPLEIEVMVPEFIEHFSLGTYDPELEIETGSGGTPWSNDSWLDVVSPVRIAQAAAVKSRHERLRDRAMSRNIMLAEDFDYQLMGFAEEIYAYQELLRSRFPLWSQDQIDHELWLEIRGRIYYGVQAHEVGHTVGLRHNFAGSADALNFFPQYWSLRQQSFDEDCNGSGFRTFNSLGFAQGDVAGVRCTGGESAADRAERSRQTLARMRTGTLEDGTYLGSINHFESSTVMDYHGDVNGRQGGLGLYDYASLAYGYAEVLEVFEEAPHRLEVVSSWNRDTGLWEDTTVTRGGSLVSTMDDVENWRRRLPGGTEGDIENDRLYDYGWTYWHYSVLPIMFWNEDASVDVQDVAQAGLHPDKFDYTALGALSGMYNRRFASASNCQGADCDYCTTDADCGDGRTCYRNPLDPRQFNGTTPGFCAVPNAGAPLLTEADVRVPYRFCEDYLRGSSSLCNIFDSGADEMEVVTRLIEDYENYYPVSAFRRGRPTFGLSLQGYFNSLVGNTFGPAVAQYQFWLLNASNRGPEWYLADRGGLHVTVAMQDALNFVSSVWATPTVGTYAPDPEQANLIVNVDDNVGYRFRPYNERFGATPEADYIDLSAADGARYGYSQFHRRREDEKAPYHYFYQYDVLSHFWAKYAALVAFTDGSVDIVGADTDSDSTAFYIPPYLAFPDEIGNYFGAIIAEDFGNFGQCATQTADGWNIQNIELIRSRTYRCNGSLLNPYTAYYGNRDYNMKLYATLFAAANFSANLDYSWLDQSSVYVWGRGETPDFIEQGGQDFEWATYTDERGTTYAARYVASVPNPNFDLASDDPEDWEPRIYPNPDDHNSELGPNVGYRLVQRAIDLQTEYELVLDQERRFAERESGAFQPLRTSSEVYRELQNHIEIVRFLVETNKVFQW